MIGQTISHYKILEKLGVGGMGVVYKAVDTKLHRFVALKFLPPELTFDAEAKERFIHEARAASALDHSNICSIYEINETEEGQSYIAMGYYHGETLKHRILRGRVGQDEAVAIAVQIAQGLARAHEADIVHRDIKPANIMLTERDEVKILDFGLAKLRGMTRVTRTGTTVGTAAYMSPEQARGEEVDRRSDIWSLGVVFYEMLAGQLPFKSEYEQGLAYLILNEAPTSLQKLIPDVSPDLVRIVDRALEKDPESRYSSTAEMLSDLKKYQESLRRDESGMFNLSMLRRQIRKPLIAIPLAAAVITIGLLSVWFFRHQAKIRWAREVAIPEIERLIAANDFWNNLGPPYKLAQQAREIMPDDPKLSDLFEKCSIPINVTTDPPGATLYIKEFDTPDSAWQYLGVSPLKQIRLPITVLRWKIEMEGYETVMAVAPTWIYKQTPNASFQIPDPIDFARVLDKKGTLPPGMVRVQATQTKEGGALGSFFMDRYEVTNRQFRQFVSAGGYRERKYWKLKFVDEGKEISWEQAMKEFVDQTGQAGPLTWQAGNYPQGQDEYPVSGISWYEANAYAEFAGKKIPTTHHWEVALGKYSGFLFNDHLMRFSNFNGSGPLPVGSLPGVTPYGIYDMGGNVREWCWNETKNGRLMRGGAWDDFQDMTYYEIEVHPLNRSAKNGLRCVRYSGSGEIPDSATRLINVEDLTVYSKQKPVGDEVFKIYREQFSYDKMPLNARMEFRKESSEGWVQEKITLDAAYNHEKITAYLFLPKNATPPFQTVIYCPDGGSLFQTSSKDIENYYEYTMFLSSYLRSGRAVLYPIYKGTFERGGEISQEFDWNNRTFAEYAIQVVRDFKRCTDYLETRTDVDTSKLAYLGLSFGGIFGCIIPAVDDRLKVNMLMGVGLTSGSTLPQVNLVNYLPRVKIPTLLMNGIHDIGNSVENSQKPLFDLLGTPAKDKLMKVYDSDHVVPRVEIMKETLGWLDKYFGPVKNK